MRQLAPLPAVLAALVALPSIARGTPTGSAARAPVVVELFSSEGCSSCPSADVVLARLDREQPVAGAEVLALELHVDYWNHLGWADPFSSAEYTSRQSSYASAFGRDGVYTPQMVVDGRAEFVGSDEGRARRTIAEAARAAKATVRVARAGNNVSVEVEGAAGAEADVWLAVTESNLRTDVKRGENGGRTLAHAPVVRTLRRLGAIAAGGTFRGQAPLALDGAWKRDALRAVVFVQERRGLHILGAGAASL
jgi:hypothetical protein